jgi:2,3-bisphosphoglycerate-dependent phosphoglycerate mutase
VVYRPALEKLGGLCPTGVRIPLPPPTYMTTFYLIRHGHKDLTPPDPGLTNIGHRQAQITGSHLAKYPITKIVASPLRRTQETAQYLAKHLNIPIQTDTRLYERMNWGDLPHQTMEEFLELWKKTTHDREYAPIGGRSSRLAGDTALELMLEELPSEHAHVALISHGGTIADLLRNIYTEEDLRSAQNTLLPELDYHVDECALTIIEWDFKPQLKLINDSSHLR